MVFQIEDDAGDAGLRLRYPNLLHHAVPNGNGMYTFGRHLRPGAADIEVHAVGVGKAARFVGEVGIDLNGDARQFAQRPKAHGSNIGDLRIG
jgi:hypothetical protein